MDTNKDLKTDAKILEKLLHPSTSFSEVEAARTSLGKRITQHGGPEKWLLRASPKGEYKSYTETQREAAKLAQEIEAHAATKAELERVRVDMAKVNARADAAMLRISDAISYLTGSLFAKGGAAGGATDIPPHKRPSRQPKAEAEPEGMLTMPQICDLLGCSRFAVANWRKDHGFPQPDAQHRYDRAAVMAWWNVNPERQASVAAKAKRKAK